MLSFSFFIVEPGKYVDNNNIWNIYASGYVLGAQSTDQDRMLKKNYILLFFRRKTMASAQKMVNWLSLTSNSIKNMFTPSYAKQKSEPKEHIKQQEPNLTRKIRYT